MNKLKNKLKRIFDEVRIFCKLTIKLSIWASFDVLLGKIYNHKLNLNGQKETPFQTKILKKKHKIINEYLLKNYDNFYNKYEFTERKPQKNMEDTIWICWWQGIENAPELVKKCVSSIQNNFRNYKVIIIDDNNYSKFVKFPQWIEDKKKKGIISKTHFSDLLRIQLLAEHGGIWLDSTFFCTDNVDINLLKKNVWTIKRPEYGHLSPACGYFANYSLGCKYDYRECFYVINDFLFEYWKNNNYVIDYLLTDYIINIVLNKYPKYKSLFDQIEDNNLNCDELFKILGAEYDEVKWRKLKNNTFLFKLSWKHNFNLTKNDSKTFFGMLMDDEL